MLNSLITQHKKIQSQWGPFQQLVDDFLCAVADVQESDRAFK